MIEAYQDKYKAEYGDQTCIRCGRPAFDNCYSVQGLKEVLISGLCEECFDEITGGED